MAARVVPWLRLQGGQADTSMIAITMADASRPLTGFSYSRAFFEDLVDQTLAEARRLGATDASAGATEGAGLSVTVRKGELESVKRNRDKSLGITVYLGRKRGEATTSDFAPEAVRRTVQAAYDIARFTAEDPAAGLPDAADITTGQRDLDLFHPWAIDASQATDIAQRCEQAAFAVDPNIRNSEGASVSAQQAHFFAAHTHGFRGGYASSRHSISVTPIAQASGAGSDMQRDFWFSSMRRAADLETPEAVGRRAAERALRRLGARKAATTQCPVLFDAPLAAGLLGSLVQALSGGALYRRTSFLLDSVGASLFPSHVQVSEDPFVPRGNGSSPFDDEGVRVQPRQVVSDGVIQGYFLSTYSARKLGLKTTGNAGGSHNLTLSSSRTEAGDDLGAMLHRLGTGLFVTELMGQGVNLITGDYSRGASGFWVEGGEIAYPVQEVTIAGNLRDMFAGVVAVGADTHTWGARTTGSVLVDRMTVAGN